MTDLRVSTSGRVKAHKDITELTVANHVHLGGSCGICRYELAGLLREDLAAVPHDGKVLGNMHVAVADCRREVRGKLGNVLGRASLTVGLNLLVIDPCGLEKGPGTARVL